MSYKKTPTPGTVQFNKLIAELPEDQGKVKTQVQFRHDILESQKIMNYKNEFDRLQGAEQLPGLDPNTKTIMNELQENTNQSLKGEPSHRSYSTKC